MTLQSKEHLSLHNHIWNGNQAYDAAHIKLMALQRNTLQKDQKQAAAS
jgi:hypothetical protein